MSQPSGRVIRLFAPLVLANIAAWGWAWATFHASPTLLGTALLAWGFGLRHAFDADHIAAIDNVVRRLMQAGQRPFTAGLYFAIGHSTVVMLALLAIALGTAAMQTQLAVLYDSLDLLGTVISASFLLVLALANLAILRGLWQRWRAARQGMLSDDAALAGLLDGRGLLARICAPVLRGVRDVRQMYLVGFLFGLGFDTATEIGLLGIAASQAASGLSPWSILVFPSLFTAGMALADTADSALMVGAYGWAFADPLRKLRYNLVVTALSVAVALLVGGVEVMGLLVDRLDLAGGFWTKVAGLNENLTEFGSAAVAIFALAWGGSVLLRRRARA
jgi:high-affinity nickel-transport protein